MPASLWKQWRTIRTQGEGNDERTNGKERLIKYEEFCARPNIILETLKITSKFESNANVAIKGKKNSKVTIIRDMSAKHFSFLGINGILKINHLLEKNNDAIKYFQYNFLSPQ